MGATFHLALRYKKRLFTLFHLTPICTVSIATPTLHSSNCCTDRKCLTLWGAQTWIFQNHYQQKLPFIILSDCTWQGMEQTFCFILWHNILPKCVAYCEQEKRGVIGMLEVVTRVMHHWEKKKKKSALRVCSAKPPKLRVRLVKSVTIDTKTIRTIFFFFRVTWYNTNPGLETALRGSPDLMLHPPLYQARQHPHWTPSFSYFSCLPPHSPSFKAGPVAA